MGKNNYNQAKVNLLAERDGEGKEAESLGCAETQTTRERKAAAGAQSSSAFQNTPQPP